MAMCSLVIGVATIVAASKRYASLHYLPSTPVHYYEALGAEVWQLVVLETLQLVLYFVLLPECRKEGYVLFEDGGNLQELIGWIFVSAVATGIGVGLTHLTVALFYALTALSLVLLASSAALGALGRGPGATNPGSKGAAGGGEAAAAAAQRGTKRMVL